MKPCADNVVGLQQWKALMCQELLEEKIPLTYNCLSVLRRHILEEGLNDSSA